MVAPVSETNHFKVVKKKVDLESFLTEELGVQLVSAGRDMKACCPFHEEKTPSFVVSDTEEGWKRWHCFGACDEGGTIIDAVMKARDYELPNEAVRYLNSHYGLGLEIDDAAYRKFAEAIKETEDAISKSTHALEDENKLADAARQYLNNRGLSDEAIEHFELGIDTERTRSGRISIPLRDSQNHPVSIALRALFDERPCQVCGKPVKAKDMTELAHEAKKAREKGEEKIWKRCPHCDAPDEKAKVAWLFHQNPKYLFKGGFEKAEFFYNEHPARRELRKNKSCEGLFVGEGYPEVWAGWMGDTKAFVSYSGASLSAWQAEKAVKITTGRDGKDVLDKPIVLVPDFDSTGHASVHKNIQQIKDVSDAQEIQVVYGIDEYKYTDYEGNEIPCKDLGDVLKHYGSKKVQEALQRRMPATEWQIRDIINEKNELTGESFHSRQHQMQLVAGVLQREKAKVTLDYLVSYLAQAWEAPVDVIRQWFLGELTPENATSYEHMFKSVMQAREEARDFMLDDNVISTGFSEIDESIPGGGMRPGQVAMALGKSGTGKALALSARLLASDGWIRMGDIKEGDRLIDPADGSECSVTAVYPQGVRQMYRVHFNDGTRVDCDIDHLWRVRLRGDWKTAPLAHLTRETGRIEIPVMATIASREETERLSFLLETGEVTDCASPDFSFHYTGPLAPEVVELIRKSGGIAKEMDDQVCFTLTGARKFVQAIIPVHCEEAQCIRVDSHERTYITDGFTVTHNTMLATQLLGNFAEQQKNSIFFTLEQAAKSLFTRLACQVLGKRPDEVEELVKSHSEEAEEELTPVYELYENMWLLDNVPTKVQPALPMTPNALKAMVQEANLTKFKGSKTDVVVIDYLSIMQPDSDAPKEIQGSDDRIPGYNMLRLFEICKELDILLIVLQQLPKEVKKGVPFAYDAGRGGSRQTDACDYIFCLWRPDQNDELSDDEKITVSGHYMIALGKNRFGRSTVQRCMFDDATLRILPQFEIEMPGQMHNEAITAIADDEDIPDALKLPEDGDRSAAAIIGGDAGKSEEAMQVLVDSSEKMPKDATRLLDQLRDDEGEIDPDLRSIFES